MDSNQSNSTDPKPSVGRIVHYKTYGNPNGPDCRAALITSIGHDEEGKIDIVIFKPTGYDFRIGVEKGDREGQWHYPERV